jgi:hypothetical protein
MPVNRGLVFWGVALVTAGLVALGIQGGLIDPTVARGAWRLWPIVLIAIGLAIIAARTPLALVGTLVAALAVGGLAGTLVAGLPDGLAIGCGGDTDERVAEEGSFTADAAIVELDLNCGEVRVGTAPGDGWRADLAHGAGEAPSVVQDSDRLHIEASGAGIVGFADVRQDWDITLPSDVALQLALSANAASSHLDLADATVDDLEVDANAGEVVLGLEGATAESVAIEANAGSVTLTADGDTVLDGSIDMNAGSLEICLAEDAVADIVLDADNVTFSHNLDDLGLRRTGDTWRAGDEGDDAGVTLAIQGNAASFTLNPDGGCA